MHREERLRLIRRSGDPLRADSGTPYPCSQVDLDGYVRFNRSNRHAVYVSATTGTNNLSRLLDIHKELEASADAAIRRLAQCLTDPHWGPDLVIKAFKDLDLAFFGGTLSGNVLVRWKISADHSNRWDPFPMSSCWGYTMKGGHGQARIVLNATVIFKHAQDPFREMWRTMLHEMCHAYLFVVSGNADNMPGEPRIETYQGGHGVHFRRCLHSVDRRSDKYLQLKAISSDEDYLEHF